MSWRPEVTTYGDDGVWTGNGLRFATKEEAEANVRNLARYWTSVIQFRVVESADPVNFRWVDGRLKELET